MLYLNGSPTELKQGLTRRDLIRVGLGASFGSLLWPGMTNAGPLTGGLTSAAHRSGPFGKAKSLIILHLFGGPSHIDTFDMKPNTPQEIRGEFKPVSTNLAGVQIVEHLPKLARHMDKVALVRSMSHGDNGHGSSVHAMLTGRLPTKVGEVPPTPDDYPQYGSVLSRLKPPASSGMPPFVTLPWQMATFVAVLPGQTGGFLGRLADPYRLETAKKDIKRFAPPMFKLPSEVNHERFDARRSLYEQIGRPVEKNSALGEMGQLYERAFGLMTSREAARAFDLDKEPPSTRERYGMNLWGQSTLMARRLVEAGVPAVTVYWPERISGPERPFVGVPPWDTHGKVFGRPNFPTLKDLLPPFDIAYTALLEDLASRGMLEQTLVIAMGEFGRSPKINADAGREHYGEVFSILLAGGGIRGGQVYGASDKTGAFPLHSRVTPGDLAATIYHCMGVRPASVIHDRLGRPLALAEGEPVTPLLV